MTTPLAHLLDVLDDPRVEALHEVLADAEHALDAAIRENGYGSPKSEPQRQAVRAVHEALDALYDELGI